MPPGRSLFDLVVVTLALVALGPITMPVNVLRSIRAFRLIRLFRRLQALREIVAALTVAIMPVLNAFFILLIVAAICKFPTCKERGKGEERDERPIQRPAHTCLKLPLLAELL